MTDRLAVYQFRELESTKRFGEQIFSTNHFNERILEIQNSSITSLSHSDRHVIDGNTPSFQLMNHPVFICIVLIHSKKSGQFPNQAGQSHTSKKC